MNSLSCEDEGVSFNVSMYGDFGMIGEGGVGEMGVRGIVWSVHLIDELFARHKKGLKEEGSITLKMRRCFLFSN